MYHRMYLRRCSMSSISEESETGDDDDHRQTPPKLDPNELPLKFDVENCLGDLNSFKEEIREAYEELSTLERQARNKSTILANMSSNIQQDADLDTLLEQLYTLEQRLDQRKMPRHGSDPSTKKPISPAIIAQFDELDQALATLTTTINNVEVEFADSGNSSSSSGVSEPTRVNQQNEGDEHFSDSGLSQSTDSISFPLMNQQVSNASSLFSCDTLKYHCGDNPIRLALEKMHEANIKKLFVKIHNDDQSTKNILIDETMSVYQILILLLHKYHLQPTLNFTIVEDLPDLHVYRVFEDHQNLINDGLIYWSRDTRNRICFQEERNKYAMFEAPETFFSIRNSTNEKLIEDILADHMSSDTIVLPDDITSHLYVKDKTRKVWKKHTCILRQSGIYQIPKSSSSSSSKRDLICLLKFDANMQLYHSKNWIESLRSPTQYGFALKYAHVQKKSSKYISYLCTNTWDECQRWISGIRIILYGVALYKNYQRMKKVVHDGLENLADLLPEQRHFNFIQSIAPSINQSMSNISLPVNQIVFDSIDTPTSLVDLDSAPNHQTFYSLDRRKTSKSAFARSSSFQSSLLQCKPEQKMLRTKSISPPADGSSKPTDTILKRSKSSKEISSRSSSAPHSKATHAKKDSQPSSSSSIIPFIQHCIQPDKTPIQVKAHKRIGLPTLHTRSSSMNNHIYDSLQDIPFSVRDDRPTVTSSQVPIRRVTEL